MHEHDDTNIGARVHDVRKRRGLSQRELADASGVSVPLIRKLEQGEVRGTRLETAHRLARSLRVPTSRLDRCDDAAPGPVAEPWRPLQRAVENPPVAGAEEPSLQGALDTLPALRTAYFGNQLGDVSALAVPLLREAEALGDDAEGRALRAHLLQIAGSVLTQAHQYDAAETALSRTRPNAA